MRITCPQCGFFRDIPDKKVPVTSTMATCPKCRHRFKFRPDPIAPRERDFRGTDRREGQAASGGEAPSSWRRPAADVGEHRPPEAAPAREPRPEQPAAPETGRPAAPEPEAETPPAAAPRPGRTGRAGQGSGQAEDTPWRHGAADEAAGDARESVEGGRPEDTPWDVPPVETPPVPPAPETSTREETPEAAPHRKPPSVGKDGVRDIWAKLQAMDDGATSRKKTAPPEEPAAEPEPEPEETTPPVAEPIPWEAQERYGFFPALFLTLRRILLHPVEFFSAMPEGRPKGRALVFNLLISEFLFIIDFLWTLAGLRAGGNSELTAALPASPAVSVLLVLLLVPPALTCGIFLDAWITHLLLLLFRNARKNFSETFRVLCYSAAPTVLSAVPVAGQILSPIILVWYMALQALGLKKIHDGAYTQILAAVFIKWSLYLFVLLAMLQNFVPGR